jgi:hypothetical protein
MPIPSLLQMMQFIYKMAFMVFLLLGLVSYARSIWKTLKKDWIYLQRLHQIPCDRCVFFTGEYNLKCTVHPCKAFKEEAIGCTDYQTCQIGLDRSKNSTFN